MKQRISVYGDGIRSRDERESRCGAFAPKTARDGDHETNIG